MSTNSQSEQAKPSDYRYSDTELWQHFGAYRDYTKHEDDLLNHRSTWHLVIQGFLFATLGVIGEWQFTKGVPDALHIERKALVYVVSIVGIVIATAALRSIRAAYDAIDELSARWKSLTEEDPETKLKPEYYDPLDLKLLPGLTGGGSDKATRHGKQPALWIPIVVMMAWLFVGLFAALDHLYPYPTGEAADVKLSCGAITSSEDRKPTEQELLAQIACSMGNSDSLQQQLHQEYHLKVVLVDTNLTGDTNQSAQHTKHPATAKKP